MNFLFRTPLLNCRGVFLYGINCNIFVFIKIIINMAAKKIKQSIEEPTAEEMELLESAAEGVNTRFQKGNEWWRQRTKHGANKKFETPEALQEACFDYFEMMDDKQWFKVDYKGKDAKKVYIPTDTPYSIKGLCLYLGIVYETWRTTYRGSKDPDFIAVVHAIESIIFVQKFEGAAVGSYNPSIIARDLQLAEKIDMDMTTGGQAINVISLGTGINPDADTEGGED